MDAEQQRSHYGYLLDLTTRWMDNDIYGHVNNVTYYSYFDTVVNQYLIEHGDLSIHTAEVVGFVVASSCQYRSPIAFPEVLQGALRVEKLGRSSVQYGLAIFKQGEPLASAYGTFTHVFVDRASSRSVPIPARIRQALERLTGA
jgi:acyl-CoA thioester hydrolase|tara:strand:- start:964 stop:1395 length:432 start_codon:yes stop_codon:yes gene_type:complete